MQNALGYIAASIVLGMAFAVGCNNRPATETSESATQTAGEEGVVTKDADGKEWVTPDSEYAKEQAGENGAEDVDDIGMAAPMNVPGMNEMQ